MISDPRVENLWLMGSPWPALMLDFGYLFLILKVLPEFMKNRKPFKLKKVLILYNFLQIIGSGYVVLGVKYIFLYIIYA